MKKLILILTVAVVLTFCFCKWELGSTEALPNADSPREALAATPPAAQTLAVATLAAGTSGSPPSSSSPLTDDRRRIFDSPDVMGTIHRVLAEGTSDEKAWALHLLVACVQTNARVSAEQSNADDRAEDQPPSAPTTVALAALKRQASDALAARCRSVKPLAHLQDRQALEDKLRAAAIANRSVLGQLEALARDQDDRWSSEQARQITNSLYSGDPVLAQAAFFVLLGAMDRDSPGGQERNAALEAALGPIYAAAPLSDFERLGGCAVLGRCGSDRHTEYPGPAPDAAVRRLEQQYRAAAESRMDARSIMAIR
jgi:hypothetical protein